MLSNEVLDVLEPEGLLGGVDTALAVFAFPEEEEEGGPVEISDGDVFCVDYLGGGVQGLYKVDREGLHSCWGVILLLIRRQMASQPKVDLPHAVLSGVLGRHGCEDLTNRAEVLLNRSLLDRLPLRVNKASADTLEENLEEDNGFLNVLEVGGDL